MTPQDELGKAGECPDCMGAGWFKFIAGQSDDGMDYWGANMCTACNGTGKSPTPDGDQT